MVVSLIIFVEAVWEHAVEYAIVILRLSRQNGREVWTINHCPRSCSGDGDWKADDSDEAEAEALKERSMKGSVMGLRF